MQPTTVLFCGVSPLLADLLKALLADIDMPTLIETSAEPEDLSVIVNELAPALVIVGTTGPQLHEHVRALLEERARTRVLALSARGQSAYLYELHPEQTSLGEASEATLRRLVQDLPRFEVVVDVPD